ncbi:hypothetical protein PIROE2DRAFT_13107 [Piromyces sp. E2]|nr:hypothetical protein PIROE2DRAFT_13107 [Piromyces sp. E2]|eukprot:OUM60991.1 hypothetical protein PIROE2DRAFT_13107 [Piromyces sp. E2]
MKEHITDRCGFIPKSKKGKYLKDFEPNNDYSLYNDECNNVCFKEEIQSLFEKMCQ